MSCCLLTPVPSAPPDQFVHASADPDLIPQGRRLLDWLYTLTTKSTKRVISGQHYLDHINTIHSETGIWVGMYGDKMMDGEHSATTVAVGKRDNFISYWQAGGIIIEDFKPPNPRGFTSMFATSEAPLTATEMVNLVTENGNTINTNWRTLLDRFATAFLYLQARNIPIIIRPFHEMNGVFWYRGHNGTDRVKNAWKYTFDYFRAKGVHNLIYCYSPAQYTNTNNNQTSHYPGNSYVDIVSFDLYEPLVLSSQHLDVGDFIDYAGLLSISGNKPFIIGEFGPKAADNASGNNSTRADYRKLMAGIKAFAPRCVGWLSWNQGWSMKAQWNDFVPQLLADPWTINRPDIPSFG